MHARPLLSQIEVRGFGFDEVDHEDIMIVTAGHHTTPGESRLDVLHKNIEVMDDVATALETTELPRVVVVVTNPLDVMTEHLTRRWRDRPVSVMGSGTALETLRLTDAVAGSAASIRAACTPGLSASTATPAYSSWTPRSSGPSPIGLRARGRQDLRELAVHPRPRRPERAAVAEDERPRATWERSLEVISAANESLPA